MAVVYEDALKKDISSKNLAGVYILIGDDSYLKNMYTSRLSSMVAERDDVFNYHKFTGNCDLQAVYDAAVQFPMMADKKCVILSDYDFDKADKTDFERLCSLLSEEYDTTLLILTFDGIEFDHKKGAKEKKLMAAAQKAGGKTVLLNHRRSSELSKMLCDGASKRGCKMESSAAYHLIEIAGDDINTLINELDKLCSFVQNGQITKDIIDTVAVKSVEASVYTLTGNILACKIPEALKTVDELFFMRIEPMIILHTISSAYMEMYRVLVGKKNGLSLKEISESFGYKGKEFVLENAAANLKKMDFKKLSLSIDALIEADSALKSFSSDSRIIIEQLVIKLVYIVAKGEAID